MLKNLPFHNLNMDVDKERKEILEISSQIKGLNESYSKKLNSLQQALKSGKASSGDKITDFLTVYFGMWEGQIAEPYNILQKNINQNIGNEVLVIRTQTRKEEMLRHMASCERGIMPDPEYYTSDFEIQLGTISNPLELNVQTGDIIIPTKGHARIKIENCFEGNLMFPEEDKWEKVDESIKNKYLELPHLFRKQTEKLAYFSYSMFGEFNQNSEIIIGKEAEQYFKKHLNGEKAYKNARKLLNPQSRGELF
jgi:hypothetical protein